jgi:DNA polymerase-3 subunit delta
VRLFLIYGEDDLSATRKADEIVSGLCPPEEQAFGLETISPESGEETADAVCAVLRNVRQALLTSSFLGGRKTVYLRQAPFFDPFTEPGKFEAVKAEIDRLLDLLKEHLPLEHFFVALTTKINKTTSFYKTFQKLGQVMEFSEPEKEKEAAETLIPLVEEALKELGLEMPMDVFRAFLDRTGFHFRHIRQELEKLSVYVGNRRTVTLSDLELMVAPIRETKFWEYADAFCTGDLAHTLHVMNRMFEQRIFPVPMIANLQNRLRDLFVLRDCLDRGWATLSGGERWRTLSWNASTEADSVLSKMANDPRKIAPPFRAAMMAAQSVRFPVARWLKWLNAALDAQAAMSGGDAIEPEITLELFTIRALGELSAKK